MARKKTLGVGAVCTVLTRYMHPAKTVAEKYPNRVHNDVMEGLLVIWKGEEGGKSRGKGGGCVSS